MKQLGKFDKGQLRESQRQKNLKSMEDLRTAQRELNLFLKRKDEVLNVEQFLEDAAIAIRKMLDSIPVMVSDLMSTDTDLPFAATAKLSFLLSTENPPMDVVIQSGVVPRLVLFLNEQYGVRFQLYAARALYAIASGTRKQANVVIEHGALPTFIQLLSILERGDLKKSDQDLKELVAAILGSMANHSPDYRDTVLHHGALTPLVALLENHLEPTMLHETRVLQTCCRTLATFCQGNPPPLFDQMRPALPILRRLIHLNPPVGVLGQICEDACLSLSCLSSGSVDQIQAVIDADVCARLIMLLGLSNGNIVEHVLRTVGNIFKGSDSQIQVLIDNGVFINLNSILMHGGNSTVLRKTCSVISTMTARGRNQIQKIMDSNVIPPLLHLFQGDDYDAEVQRDAACALSYAARRGSNEQIRSLVNQGCIRPLCDFLIFPDRKTSILCLEGLKSILKAGEAENSSRNPYAQIISDFNGFGLIQNIRTDPELGETATKLLEQYGDLG